MRSTSKQYLLLAVSCGVYNCNRKFVSINYSVYVPDFHRFNNYYYVLDPSVLVHFNIIHKLRHNFSTWLCGFEFSAKQCRKGGFQWYKYATYLAIGFLQL